MTTERGYARSPEDGQPRQVGPEEARRISEASDLRYEYWNGWLYQRGSPPGSHRSMAGGTLAHSRVITRLHYMLEQHLQDGPCFVFDDNVELHPSEAECDFPDAFVTCAPLDDPAGTSQPDATLVVEVLSPRTAEFDRTAKFDAYRRLPSLQEYLLLDSRYMRADLYRKLDEQWVQITVLADGELVLTSIGLVLPLGTLYLRTGVPRTLADTLADA